MDRKDAVLVGRAVVLGLVGAAALWWAAVAIGLAFRFFVVAAGV